LLTPKVQRTTVHDASVSTSSFAYVRGSFGCDANGEGMKIKIEGSRNKRKRSDDMQETKVNKRKCNTPPSKIQACPGGGNRKLG
jgi:hypothetical protein